MKARSLLNGAVYGPEAVKAACQAFDAAWADIAPNFGSDPRTVELARLRLAHAVLAVSDDNSRDPEALKDLALQVMALKAPRRNDL
jgi:hypothetical protein